MNVTDLLHRIANKITKPKEKKEHQLDKSTANTNKDITKIYCRFCGKRNSSIQEYCTTCGMRLNSLPSAIMKACTKCGLAMNDDSVFCASCGTRFDEDT
jgi:hypothetical protein